MNQNILDPGRWKTKVTDFGNFKQRILNEKATNFVSKPSNRFWKNFGQFLKNLNEKEVTNSGNLVIV